MLSSAGVSLYLLLLAAVPSKAAPSDRSSSREYSASAPYDSRPISYPTFREKDGSLIWKLGAVTDLDKDSSLGNGTWMSIFRRGRVIVPEDLSSLEVKWDDDKDTRLLSRTSVGGRSMELSDLVVFDRRLFTADDRTGAVLEIIKGKRVKPFVILHDGPGNVTKPMKAEWMTVKDEHLYVGGHGKEWTDMHTADFINDWPMWVKRIDREGNIEHISWTENYRKVRAYLGINFPGYITHEAVQWSPIHKRWFFLPRRVSHAAYNELLDEHRGSDLLISVDEDFEKPHIVHIGETTNIDGISTRGFSAFQFIPGTHDTIIVALKSEEIEGISTGSWSTGFDIYGRRLQGERPLGGKLKFEGLAFI